MADAASNKKQEKKMKKGLVILALMVISSAAFAQFSLGPRVALVNSKLSLKDDVTNLAESDASFGYQFGLFARVKVPIVGLYVQPEVLFTQTESVLNISNQDVNFDFNRIDIPVMIGAKIGPLRINAGPSFSFLTSAESDLFGDVKDNYQSTTVGYQAGLGFDLLKFVVDVKYEGGLSTFGESVAVGGVSVDTDQRISQWVFALGFKLF